ncbi:Type 1 glutamine amidotransferase-like domain-containing protein [Enterococcus bulliens]
MKTKFLCSSFLGSQNLFTSEVCLRNKHIGFIPTASVVEEYSDYVTETYNFFEKSTQQITKIELDQISFAQLEDVLKRIDILFISGGNTFYLLEAVKRSGLAQLLEEYLANGNYLIGESAGAVIMTPDIAYINAMDDPQKAMLSDTNGLSLVDRPIIPHVASTYLGEAAETLLKQFQNQVHYALSDEEALFF